MKNNIKKELLTSQQLADLLGVNLRLVYEHVKNETLPFYRIGGVVRFNPSEVLDAMKVNPSINAKTETNGSSK